MTVLFSISMRRTDAENEQVKKWRGDTARLCPRYGKNGPEPLKPPYVS